MALGASGVSARSASSAAVIYIRWLVVWASAPEA
jgi:hypothetical protein